MFDSRLGMVPALEGRCIRSEAFWAMLYGVCWTLKRTVLSCTISVTDNPDKSSAVYCTSHWGDFQDCPILQWGLIVWYSPISSVLLIQAAQKELPSLEKDIAAGKFETLRKWLNEKVHSKGSLYTSGDELMKAATGSPLDVSVFLDYLKDKYSKLYSLSWYWSKCIWSLSCS